MFDETNLGTGNTIVKAVKVLKDHHVLEENIILANLFCTPTASQAIVNAFPQVNTISMITSCNN